MESRRHLAPRLLAGLQVGILGGLGTLVWLVILSAWNLQGPWTLVNLLAYATRAAGNWESRFSMASIIGMAAHFFTCGSLGLFCGWLLPRPNGRTRVSIAALIFGVLLSLVTYHMVWVRIAPALGQYIAPASVWVAHVMFGVSLAQFPRFYLMLEPDVIELPPLIDPEVDSTEAD
ncbi:MAG: hypothetical protein U0R19_08065 [Bryobacteraceae bacterium]